MTLKTYKSKRNFRKTTEPSVASTVAEAMADEKAMEGKPSGLAKFRKVSKLPIFVVQKHNASHLHYDFRLEVDGVLKSWAVPKGPPQKTSEKRLAVMTEDHPIAYAQFEGRIPKGQYGAGIVKIWDKGTYECEHSVKSALRAGQIEIILKGKKLKGKYALIRTKMGDDKKNWLLIKMKDKIKVL